MSDFELSPYLPVEELRARLEALKQAVLGRIYDSFTGLPAPVNNIDTSPGADCPNYGQLLAYSVSTPEESEAFVTELTGKDFGYETADDRSGRGDYAMLTVEVLIDLVQVLENRPEWTR